MGRIKFLLSVYLAEIQSKRWLFMAVAWALTLVAIPVILMIPDKYETSAQIYVDTDKLLEQVLSKTTLQVNDTTRSQAQKVQQMIYASDNLRRVLKNTNLDVLNKNPLEEMNMVERMRKNLSFESTIPDLYKISYVDNNKEVAYKVLKEIINIFIETNIRQLSAKSDRAVAVSEDALKARRRALAEAQKQLSEFKRENQDVLQSAGLLVADLRQAENVIETYTVERRSLEARLGQLQAVLAQTPKSLSYGGGGGADLPKECDTSDLKEEISRLKARGLKEIHPDVAYLKELLARKNKACADIAPSGGGSKARSRVNPVYLQISDQVQAAKSDLSRLKSEYEMALNDKKRLKRLLTQQPVIIEKYEILEKNKERAANDLYAAEDNNDRLRGTIDAGRKASLVNYQIIDNVMMPLKPVSPNRLALFAGGLIASLVGAAGFVILKMETDQRMPTLHHLREIFDLPVLGGVTYIYKPGEKDADKKNFLIWLFLISLLIILYIVFIHYFHFTLERPNLKSALLSLFNGGGNG